MWTPPGRVPTVESLVSKTEKTVAGLKDQREWLSLIVHRHMVAAKNERNYRVHNVVILGPTGGGKTHMVRSVLHSAAVPFIEINSTMYSETGYIGLDLSSLFLEFFRPPWVENGKEKREIKPLVERWGVVVLDEFDKWRKPQTSDGKERHTGQALQAELLRMIEGDVVLAKRTEHQAPIPFDTSHVLFIAVGAFEGIDRIVERRLDMDIPYAYQKTDHDDLHTYGFLEELCGRFPLIMALPPLDIAAMSRVFREHILPTYVQQMKDDGIELIFEDSAINQVSQMARDKGIGARGFPSIVDPMVRKSWAQAKRGQRIIVRSVDVIHGTALLEAA